MDDLISRQKAIDAMCWACGYDCDKSKFVYNAPQDEQVIMCPEHYALSTLPSAQPEPHWVSCSERLPKEDVEVLVTDDAGGITTIDVDRCGMYEDTKERFWYTSQHVIAWMPLPEPYKEESDG